MTRVLIADDDIVVRDVVRRYLERDGLDVSIAHDGTEALRLLGSERIDVAVLDVMMPGPDGLTLCRSLRQRGGYTVPVILLTALGEEDDRIAGLEAGADDYLTKPFSPRELALRVRSVLRRASSPVSVLPLDIAVGDMTVSTAARSVTINGEPISLTNREFDLLMFFLTHSDKVFSRLPHSQRQGVLPRRTAETGVALGLWRSVDGDCARQTAAVEARRPPPGADGLGPWIPVERR